MLEALHAAAKRVLELADGRNASTRELLDARDDLRAAVTAVDEAKATKPKRSPAKKKTTAVKTAKAPTPRTKKKA